MGKQKANKAGIFSPALRAALALPLLASCAGANAPVNFRGKLTPVAGTCEPPGDALLIRRGRFVQFTPREGVLILEGQIAPDGSVSASLQTPGADRRPYRLTLRATLAGTSIKGEYVTPRCRYRVDLAAQ